MDGRTRTRGQSMAYGSATTRQITLFQDQCVDLEPLVKAAMHQSAKNCGLSREQLCDKMNTIAHLSGIRLNKNARKLSLEILDKWLNRGERDHFPSLNALQVFMLATADDTPLQALARALGSACISPDEQKILKSALIDREIERLRKEKKKLEVSK